MAELDALAIIHFTGHNSPMKCIEAQESPGLVNWPKQVKILQKRVLGGQSSVMCTAAPDTTNPLANSPEICIANFIPQEEHPTAYSKQSRYKQSQPWHPSTCYNKLWIVQ